MYDAGTGRYLEADPVGQLGDVNPYVYAMASPLTYIDRRGMDANTWTYGEIRAWAITSLTDFTPPANLPDAKASINQACSSNPNPNPCNSVNGSSAVAPADQAAWRNILNASGGQDRTGGGEYMCVGNPQDCGYVNQCTTCQDCKPHVIDRAQSLAPTGTVTIQGHTLYFYHDPLNGWDTPEHYRSGCSCDGN